MCSVSEESLHKGGLCHNLSSWSEAHKSILQKCSNLLHRDKRKLYTLWFLPVTGSGEISREGCQSSLLHRTEHLHVMLMFMICCMVPTLHYASEWKLSLEVSCSLQTDQTPQAFSSHIVYICWHPSKEEWNAYLSICLFALLRASSSVLDATHALPPPMRQGWYCRTTSTTRHHSSYLVLCHTLPNQTVLIMMSNER